MTKYPHIAKAIFDTPWYLMPAAMSGIVEVIELRLDGGRLSQVEVEERLAAAQRAAGPRGGGRLAGNLAIIPVYGVLSHRANMMTDMSGGTSVQGLTQTFRQAMADPEIAGVLLDVDSPGGQVAGIPELADEIRASVKPTVAVSNSLCASAALYLASQCDEFVVTPSSLTGSIGVVMAHIDQTGMEEQMGIKTTLVYAGANKVETYPEIPLSADAQAYLQSLVDDVYGLFLNAVAKGRGTTVAAVKADFGQGRLLSPKNAVAVGMADRVDTFEGAIQRLASGKVQSRNAAAIATSGLVAMLAPEDLEDAPRMTAIRDAMLAETNGITLDPEVPRETADRDALALAKARRRGRGA